MYGAPTYTMIYPKMYSYDNKVWEIGAVLPPFCSGDLPPRPESAIFQCPGPPFFTVKSFKSYFFSWLKPNFCWFNPHFFGITSAGGQVSGFDVRSSIARRVAGAWRHGFLLIFPGNPGFWGITFPSSNQSMICLGRYDLFSGASAKPRL